MIDQIDRLRRVADDSPEADEREDLVLELQAAQRALAEERYNLQEIVLDPSDVGIYWIEKGFSGRVSLHAAPLHVGAMLQERLFERQTTSVPDVGDADDRWWLWLR